MLRVKFRGYVQILGLGLRSNLGANFKIGVRLRV